MFLILLAGLETVTAVVPRQVPSYVVATANPEQLRNRRVQFDVVMRSGKKVIWQGSLWVSPRSGANLRQSVNEALPDECTNLRTYGDDRGETSIGLAITSGDEGEKPSVLTVNARWVRPAEAPCDGTRVVEVRQSVPLDGTAPVVIQGDGGLVVEVRRR